MKKFLVWLICLILLTQPVFAQSEKLIILNTNTGQDTDLSLIHILCAVCYDRCADAHGYGRRDVIYA